MPITLFPISGICRDAFGNTKSGVSITVSNDVLNEILTTTSNNVGEWNIDLGDMTGQWTNGNGISIAGSLSGYQTVKRSYTLVEGDTALNTKQDFVMMRIEHIGPAFDKTSADFLLDMARVERSFMKGPEEYTLTTSLVNLTGTDEFLELPQGHSAFITGLYSGTSDVSEVVIEFRKASNEDPSQGGTTFTKIGRAIMVTGAGGSTYIPIEPAIKVSYSSTNAKSLIVALKGGTGDGATVIFTGFLIGGQK